VQVDAERTYHQKVITILEKLYAEVCNYVPWLWTQSPVICSVPHDHLIFCCLSKVCLY
jgi:hypothetical protein